MVPFRTIIGLEVHVELLTNSKMFCRCKNEPFGVEPNTNVCPVCMGLPGTLPTPNKEAVRKTIMVGKALGSTIPKLSKWDRKHYFYPDLPKGYQISQYDLPFCVGGKIELLADDGSVDSTVRFIRAHLEEDAGKLFHGGRPGYSQVDYNRASVPLLEMVSEPDMTSAAQARRFLQEVQLLARTLGVSDADMEKGMMRCDVNVNISFPELGKGRTPITEIKNVNSSRAVERSITYEAQRQYDEWMAGGPIRTRVHKLTVGWDENKEILVMQRAKEEANDYRYMPEPDLPPVEVYKDRELNPDNIVLPELPNDRRRRYLKLGISMAETDVLIGDPIRVAYLEKCLDLKIKLPRTVVNWLINAPGCVVLSPEVTVQLIEMATQGSVSFSALKPRLTELSELLVGKANGDLFLSLQSLALLQIHDASVVELAIADVLKECPEQVRDYKSGNERIFGFLVGQVMKRTAGKAQPAKVSEALKQAIEIVKQ